MKKVIIVIICIFLFSGNAFALDYDDLYRGMNSQEIKALLNGFDIQENEKHIFAKSLNIDINVSFKEGKANSITFAKHGQQLSSLDFFDADWSLLIDDIVHDLEKEQTEYEIKTIETRHGIGLMKHEKLEQPETIKTIEFYGYMDFLPVKYHLIFDQEEYLSEIRIRDIHKKQYATESNFLSIFAFLVNQLGEPDEIKTEDMVPFSVEEGSCLMSNSCYWINHNNKYETEIETSLDPDSTDDEPYAGYLSNSILVTIVPIEN